MLRRETGGREGLGFGARSFAVCAAQDDPPLGGGAYLEVRHL